MRKRVIKILLLAFFFIVLLLFCLNFYRIKQLFYYRNTDHFVQCSGTVNEICYDEEYKMIYLTIKDLSVAFADDSFCIKGECAERIWRQYADKLKKGIIVDFISADGYFGDGFDMPIVALSVNGEELLSFNEGYADLIHWLRTALFV